MARSHALVGSEKHVIVPFSSEMTVIIAPGPALGRLGVLLHVRLARDALFGSIEG